MAQLVQTFATVERGLVPGLRRVAVTRCPQEGFRILGFRYSTSLLAIIANRLARRPPHQQNKEVPLRGAHSLFLPWGVLLSDLR